MWRGGREDDRTDAAENNQQCELKLVHLCANPSGQVTGLQTPQRIQRSPSRQWGSTLSKPPIQSLPHRLGASTAANAVTVRWNCTNANNQRWQALPVSTGYYRFVPSAVAWKFRHAAPLLANGSIQATCAATPAQYWSPVKKRGQVSP